MRKPPITAITHRSGDESLLNDIQDLWEALNRHHRDAAGYLVRKRPLAI
jgi:hypothetical protein